MPWAISFRPRSRPEIIFSLGFRISPICEAITLSTAPQEILTCRCRAPGIAVSLAITVSPRTPARDERVDQAMRVHAHEVLISSTASSGIIAAARPLVAVFMRAPLARFQFRRTGRQERPSPAPQTILNGTG